MLAIERSDIAAMESRYRTTLINSLWGFRPLSLIGTNNGEGQNNLAIFNSIVHLGAHPPLFGLVFRPDSVERHTLENIRAIGEFTVNSVGKEFAEKAHQTSARYPRHISEFEAVGLSMEMKPTITVPFVRESKIQIHAKLEEEHPFKINGTVFLIASVQSIYVPNSILFEDGFINHSMAGSAIGIGLDAYYESLPIARFPYAKAK